MKSFVFKMMILVVITGIFPSCKKAVEKTTADYVMSIITSGRWYMYNFSEDQINITTDFNGYEFQFYDNGTVDGIKNNVRETGTWKPDITNYTITANFPSSNYPLNKLNNLWKIVDSYSNSVIAEATSGTISYKMQLVKK
jgi:hypothetical protein